MIQDLGKYTYDNHYDPEKTPGLHDIALCFAEHAVLVWEKQDRGVLERTLPEIGEVQAAFTAEPRFAFRIGEKDYYLVDATAELREEDACLPAGMELVDARQFRGAFMPEEGEPFVTAFAVITGWQLFRWYGDRRYCGRCGKPMLHSGKERMVYCPDCGTIEYPKICPAVIVGVLNHDRILLTKYAGRAYAHFALVAGFTEIGETIEQTVAREVMEETGVRVKNLRFYKSQPWSFSSSLLMGFFCDLDGDETITVDQDELSEAGWYRQDEVPVRKEGISLTEEMMNLFAEGGYEGVLRATGHSTSSADYSDFEGHGSTPTAVLRKEYGINVPVKMRKELEHTIQTAAGGTRQTSARIYEILTEQYVNNQHIFQIMESGFTEREGILAEVRLYHRGAARTVKANGNGRLDAVSNAIKQYFGISYELESYDEHALSSSSSSKAIAFVGILAQERRFWGIGFAEDILQASISALVSAVNQIPEIKEKEIVDERLMTMLNRIQEDYQTITLGDLAKEMYLSEPYVSKYIREKSGMTFGDHVKKIRLRRAKTLLKNSSVRVEEIAGMIGYQNVEHFNRLFKKEFGITPVQMRKE